MSRKKDLIQKALNYYQRKLEYDRQYRKQNYDVLAINLKKVDVEKIMQKHNIDRKLAKKLLAYIKLKKELKKAGIIGQSS